MSNSLPSEGGQESQGPGSSSWCAGPGSCLGLREGQQRPRLRSSFTWAFWAPRPPEQ